MQQMLESKLTPTWYCHQLLHIIFLQVALCHLHQQQMFVRRRHDTSYHLQQCRYGSNGNTSLKQIVHVSYRMAPPASDTINININFQHRFSTHTQAYICTHTSSETVLFFYPKFKQSKPNPRSTQASETQRETHHHQQGIWYKNS